MKDKKSVCLISGGLDSTVAVSVAENKGYALYFLFIKYGQKTEAKEEECIDKLDKYYQPIETVKVKLPWLKDFGGSALFDKNIELDESNTQLEYVPFRNSIFLSIATALAEVVKADRILVGSTEGDRICPDNSPQYLNAFQKVIDKGTMKYKGIEIEAPLIRTDKSGSVKVGKRFNTPFELTWSCHNERVLACGHCSNCKARVKAFESNKTNDPIAYKKDEK